MYFVVKVDHLRFLLVSDLTAELGLPLEDVEQLLLRLFSFDQLILQNGQLLLLLVEHFKGGFQFLAGPLPGSDSFGLVAHSHHLPESYYILHRLLLYATELLKDLGLEIFELSLELVDGYEGDQAALRGFAPDGQPLHANFNNKLIG